jgi:hypothetical protein
MRPVYKVGTPARRRLLKAYYRECGRVNRAFEKIRELTGGATIVNGRIACRPPSPWPAMPPYPEECRGMTCAARTRRGTLCRQIAIYGNGRCKFHGGLSTGPRTVEGKRRSALNGFRPKHKKRTP